MNKFKVCGIFFFVFGVESVYSSSSFKTIESNSSFGESNSGGSSPKTPVVCNVDGGSLPVNQVNAKYMHKKHDGLLDYLGDHNNHHPKPNKIAGACCFSCILGCLVLSGLFDNDQMICPSPSCLLPKSKDQKTKMS